MALGTDDIISLCTSLLGILGSLLIMISFVFLPELRTYFVRLIFTLSIISFLVCLNYAVMALTSSEEINGTCIMHAFFMQVIEMAQFIWNTCIAWHLFSVHVLKKTYKETKTYYKWYHIITWSISFPQAFALLFVPDLYGLAGSWCWISDEFAYMSYVMYYGPLWVMFLFTSVLYISMIIAIYWRPNKELSLIEKTQARTGMLYILTFFIAWIFPSANRLMRIISVDLSPQWVRTAHTLTGARAPGYLNGIIYSGTQKVQRNLYLSSVLKHKGDILDFLKYLHKEMEPEPLYFYFDVERYRHLIKRERRERQRQKLKMRRHRQELEELNQMGATSSERGSASAEDQDQFQFVVPQGPTRAQQVKTAAEMAQFIFDRYFSKDAEFNIEIDSDTRDSIETKLQHGALDKNMFERAQRMAFARIKRDIFPRFKLYAQQQATTQQQGAATQSLLKTLLLRLFGFFSIVRRYWRYFRRHHHRVPLLRRFFRRRRRRWNDSEVTSTSSDSDQEDDKADLQAINEDGFSDGDNDDDHLMTLGEEVRSALSKKSKAKTDMQGQRLAAEELSNMKLVRIRQSKLFDIVDADAREFLDTSSHINKLISNQSQQQHQEEEDSE